MNIIFKIGKMGREINLLDTHPGMKRDYDKRAIEKTPEVIAIAKKFDRDFFDGERKYGYDGYKYDGRWKSVVKGMKEVFLCRSGNSTSCKKEE